MDIEKHADWKRGLADTAAMVVKQGTAWNAPYIRSTAAYILEVHYPGQLLPAARYTIKSPKRVWAEFLSYVKRNIPVRVLHVTWVYGRRHEGKETELQAAL